MKKETLAKAKELEEDINSMKSALSYYKKGQWSHWSYTNDRADYFHFAFCKNYSSLGADRQVLPTWLNKPLMEVIERELQHCEARLEALTDDSEEGAEVEINKAKIGDDLPNNYEPRQPKKKNRFWRIIAIMFKGD